MNVEGTRGSSPCQHPNPRQPSRFSRRIGVGPHTSSGAPSFAAPLILIPAAGGPQWFVLPLVFVSEFLSGVGLMLLDIMAGTITAGIVPTALRSRVRSVHGRELRRAPALGTTLGGILDMVIGVRSTLWIATVGALLGLVWLIPSPIPHLRHVPAEATG